MILGDNDIFVGIGLSNDPTGPRSKLEINAGSTYPNVSGLQFTQLTIGYNPGITENKFLTLDNDGNVILRDIPGGGGGVTVECNYYNTQC
jgi:hypothetical protein